MDLPDALAIADDVVFEQSGRRLREVEWLVLKGCWNDQTYDAIADATGYSLSYLNRTVAPKLWQTLSYALGEKVGKKNFRFALERRWRQGGDGGDGEGRSVASPASALLLAIPSPSPAPTTTQTDWGEAIDVSIFYGRQAELDTLTQWIAGDRCRLVAILGMGGMGKTALSVRLAQHLSTPTDSSSTSPSPPPFTHLIWRSLRNAPPLETLLADLVPFLSNQQEAKAELGKLVQCLRQSRCLVILDNLETLLDEARVGQFRTGFEDYGDLLCLLGEVGHQSCVVLTSREKPAEVAALEGVELAVRSLRLEGSPEAAQAIIQGKGLTGSPEQQQRLGDRYGNSPLALKIAATSVQELFDGDIAAFLQEDTFVFNGVRRLLDQQFQRLSALEQSIMYWLAINREWTTLAELATDIVPTTAKGKLLEALEALSFRSLIEKQATAFTQQPVVMEYVVEGFTNAIAHELSHPPLSLFLSHAIVCATAKDYLRQSQEQLIAQPIIDQLRGKLGSNEEIANQMQQVLQRLRQSSQLPNYGAGNILNLMRCIPLDLAGYNFAQLPIRQAYLLNVPLRQVNLAQAQIQHSVFAEPLHNNHGLAFSPDGKYLAMTGLDGSLTIFEAATRQRHLSIPAHDGWTLGLAFAPDSQAIVTGSFDQQIKLWNVLTGKCIQDWRTESAIWRVAFNADGTQVVSTHEDCLIRIWDWQTGTLLRSLKGHEAAITGIAFPVGGSVLATVGFDCTVRIWDFQSGNCLHRFGGHTNTTWAVAIDAAQTCAASASYDGSIKLWNMQTGALLQTLQLHTDQVSAVQYSPDGQLLASGSYDCTIRFWNPETGQLLRILQGHTSTIWSLVFSPDGKTLVSGSEECQVKFWDVETGRCIQTLQGERMGIWSVQMTPQANGLVSGGEDCQLRFWNLATGQQTQQMPGNHTVTISRVAIHPQGHLIASTDHGGLVNLWDANGNRLYGLGRHPRWAAAVAFHPRQPLLASCGSEAGVRLWHTQTGEFVGKLMQDEAAGHVYEIAFHPHQSLLASGSERGDICLWDIQSQTIITTFSGHASRVWQLIFHPQGGSLISGSHDGTIRVWSLATGECSAVLQDRSGAVMSMAISPDGGLLAEGSDRTIRLWDLQTGHCLKVIERHTNTVSSLAFHPHFSETLPVLISASYDETICLWNIATEECLQVLRPNRLYEGMNITGVRGLTEAQKAVLKKLGAIEAAIA